MYKILLANKGDFECFKDKTGKATSRRIAEVERIEVTQLSLPQKAMNMAKKTVAPLSNINVTCQRKTKPSLIMIFIELLLCIKWKAIYFILK